MGKKIDYDSAQITKAMQSILKIKYKNPLPRALSINMVIDKDINIPCGENNKPITEIIPISKIQVEKDKDSEEISIVKINISPELFAGSPIYVDVQSKHPHQIHPIDMEFEFSSAPIVENKHDIEGYAPFVTYNPGEKMELKVHSPLPSFSVDFIRYGAKEKLVHQIKNIHGKKQNYDLYAYRNGANWETSHLFQIPLDWQTGLYGARLYDASGKEFHIPFNLRDTSYVSRPKNKRIAILSSTNTWQAYNSWGGASLYWYFAPDHIKPSDSAQLVNTQRPNPAATPVGEVTHLASGEKYILAWLENNHFPYSLISDWDLHHQPHLLKDFGTLIINTHGEYWTKEMYDALEQFMDQGGNVVSLSGNGCYWKTVIKENLMEVRKDGSHHLLIGERGGLWRDLERTESRMLGVRYNGPATDSFYPYKIKNADHWIFANTGLKNGDLVGEKGLRGGASGHETDIMDEFTPKNTILLAKGTNPKKKQGAEMIYYDHPKGGGVFSVGSIAFGSSLIMDSDLTKIVKNVLDRFLK
ncbi:hypothetical protein J2Z48_001185 [Croceifilum oryzae]|uniref:N,N-dimethylformamidase beta subunit-like C-terminal domain-containing protein n=1 Tax=Croceifilum oryzae TaxID=1553429 RepID=A0AAJ1WSI1_9BACL|nr:N,N-dimethylformamidase beta subunit family domain-containing protein [Croceifilum oryzae]MDQ0417013.1 hypothetical protein [Croceifilum oryzae]